jgi:TRAP transporter TAXI family solute receptor
MEVGRETMNKIGVNKIAMAVAAVVLVGLAAVWLVNNDVFDGSYNGSSASGQNFITIGTGGVTGVYYPAGGAICRLVNKGRDVHGYRCAVESTGGSIQNLNAIRNGDMELGIVQSDWQYYAWNGTGSFKQTGPFAELRSVFSIHSEAFTVVARSDSGIKTFQDLKGKRVNVGNAGSGQRATMDVVLDAFGWTMKDFAAATEFKPAEQAQALCDGKVDAIVYIVGHPNGAIQEATTACDTTLVDVAGPEIDKLLEDHPYYAPAVIPGGLYDGNEEDVHTFGVKATLVSSSNVDDDAIYEVVKAVFDNFDDFRNQHPAFTYLDPKRLPMEGNTAPLHEGAERYFSEQGMIE